MYAVWMEREVGWGDTGGVHGAEKGEIDRA